MAKRLRILHLSDLHMGQERGAARWRLRDVLGQAWRDNLDAIAQDRPVDLVCFTGDLAFSGKPEQYREAGEAIDFLLRRLKLDQSRFFCVPGNHDIDRDLEADAWRQLRDAHDVRPEDFDPWIAGQRTPRSCDDRWRDAVLLRRGAYDDWLTTFGLDHLLPKHHRHGRLGYRITFAPDELGNAAPLHIVGFDSAWLAGDGDHREQDNANLRLTREQVGRLLSDDNGDALTGHAIGLMHHPFSNLIENESQSMPGLMSRKGLGLLLHGHLHDLRLEEWASPRHGLYISSAGSQYQRNDLPNTIHLLDVDLSSGEKLHPVGVWVRAWSPEGFWHDDNSRYAGMQNGRLQLVPEPITPFTPTPGTFVGRTGELDQLRAALLPAARGTDTRPTVICCAIDGMPGVGKTRLAEEFVGDDWRETLGLPKGTPQQDYCARLALGQDDRRSAEDLAAAVLAGYQRNVPVDQAINALREVLLSGPGGRRLLLIENVDGPAQAKAVATLVTRLSGCALLVTARYRDLAGAGWERIPVAPLPLAQAIDLLRNRIALGRKPHPLKDDEATALVQRLGYLPLALHIAGSHLGRGLSPQGFHEQLETHRLALGPVAASDAANNSDAARSVIAGAFAISWDLWCRLVDVDRQAALVALSHGPAAGVGDALGAVIADLSRIDYEDCTIEADSLSLLEVDFVKQDGEIIRRVRLHPLIAEFLRNHGGVDDEIVAIRLLNWCNIEFGMGPERPTKNPAWDFLRFETPEALRWLARSLRLVNDRREKKSLNAELHGKIAGILQDQGEFTDSLKMYRDEVLPIYEKLGDMYSSAITRGQIANILQSSGDLVQALRIRREEELPVYERLGDVRSRAITQGKIAHILQSLGELEEALRIRREEELPVYEHLGDVRSLLVARANLTMTLLQRGRPEDRPEVLALLQQALSEAERLGLSEAETIRVLITQIFGGGYDGVQPS